MDLNGSTADATQALHEHAARAAQQREQLTGGVRDLLTAEEAVVEELTELLRDAKSRRDHLHKALGHLLGETPAKPGPKPKAERVQWSVSDETVQKVLDGFLAETEPITKTQLAAKIKMGSETMAKAIAVLRERDQLRMTGKTRGGGSEYVVMPDVRAASEAVADAA